MRVGATLIHSIFRISICQILTTLMSSLRKNFEVVMIGSNIDSGKYE